MQIGNRLGDGDVDAETDVEAEGWVRIYINGNAFG